MAINPLTRYPSQVDGTDPTGYPNGKAKNVNTPGDSTGTPLEKDWVNDIWGFQQAALAAAGLSPSGTPDKVGGSQLLQALPRAKVEIFTANGTWTKPPGASHVHVVAIGGGAGGGGKNGGVRAGGGGASGQLKHTWLDASALAATVAVTVGTGGALNSDGTSSSFGPHVTASSLGVGGKGYLNGIASAGDGGGGGGLAAGSDGNVSSGGKGGANPDSADYSRDFIVINSSLYGASRQGHGGGGTGGASGSPGYCGLPGELSNGGGGGSYSGAPGGRGGGRLGGSGVVNQNGNCGGGWGGGGGGEAGASGSGGGGGGGWADIPGWPASAQQTSGQPGAVMVITYFA